MPGQQLNASIIAQTRLKSPEEFGRVTLKVIGLLVDDAIVVVENVERA